MPILIYLRLRLLLLGRLARELGWWRLGLVAGLLPLALLQAGSVLGRHPLGRWALPALAALALLGAHRQRADLRFLAAVPGHRAALATEYALLGLPLALGLATLRAWGPALPAVPLLALLAGVPPARAAAPGTAGAARFGPRPSSGWAACGPWAGGCGWRCWPWRPAGAAPRWGRPWRCWAGCWS